MRSFPTPGSMGVSGHRAGDRIRRPGDRAASGWEEPLAKEPAGAYQHSVRRPLLGRKLKGKSVREMQELGLSIDSAQGRYRSGTGAVGESKTENEVGCRRGVALADGGRGDRCHDPDVASNSFCVPGYGQTCCHPDPLAVRRPQAACSARGSVGWPPRTHAAGVSSARGR